MKVRVDVFLGEENRIDLSFLEKREAWLPGTGVYLEFILKGVYDKSVDFRVTGEKNEVMVSRYSWNRFFLNLRKSGTVRFAVVEGDKEVAEKELFFNVVDCPVPLVLSVSNLLTHPVSDIRYFANRLSESLINSTRFTLFTPGFMEKLSGSSIPSREFVKFYEMIFSILTERGLTLIVAPYGDMLYPMDFIKDEGKEILLDFVEVGRKYRIVWDFTTGLRQKELGGLLDSVWSRFKQDINYAVTLNMADKVGGEGFANVVKEFKLDDVIAPNTKGDKIARIDGAGLTFSSLRMFTKKAVSAGWGVECSCVVPFRRLRTFKYALARSILRGYGDAN